jgi:hypothetical protein
MLGTFQQSNLRIEIDATQQQIADSLLNPAQFQKWLFPQTFSPGLSDRLKPGTTYTSWLGPIAIQHRVEQADDNGLRLLLHQGIDGFHEWHWGDGWIQSDLEGVSLLPLNVGQTLGLIRLRQYLSGKSS